jgi:hypothetical protein
MEGRLIIRVTIPGTGFRLFRFVEALRLGLKGVEYYFRSSEQITRIIEEAKFKVEIAEPSAPGREETWFIANFRI